MLRKEDYGPDRLKISHAFLQDQKIFKNGLAQQILVQHTPGKREQANEIARAILVLLPSVCHHQAEDTDTR